jgi:PAS domain S-box-containing protein
MPDRQESPEYASAQGALRRCEQLFRAFFDLEGAGAAQLDPDGGWLMVNRKLCALLGCTLQELMQRPLREFSPPEELPSYLEQLGLLLSGASDSFSLKRRYLRRDGSQVSVQLTMALVRDPEGTPLYFTALFVEIGGCQRVLEELHESQEKFSKIFSLAPVGMTISTLDDGRFVDINEAGELLSGYRREEVIGRTFAQFDIWASAEERARVIGEVLEKGVVRDREMVMRNKSGRPFWCLFSAVLIEIGGARHLLSLVSDIAERKRAQDALRESEERFRLLADTAPVIIWEAAPDGRLRFLNQAGLDYTGRRLEEELGDGWTQGVHPDDLERCLGCFLEAVRTGSALCMEYRLRRASGEYGWILETAVPRFALSGALLGFIGTCVDITESKRIKEQLKETNKVLEQRVAERTAELSLTVQRLQEEIDERVRMGQALQAETAERLHVQEELREKELMLLQQSRLAAMGEMISNIAHQWRQPLNLLALLAQDLPVAYRSGTFSEEFLAHNVAKTLETIRHMSQTIDDFRNFFQPVKEKVDFNIMEVVAKTLSLMEGSLKAQHIETRISNSCSPVVHGYPNEFTQVLLNILINARDALVAREAQAPSICIRVEAEGDRTVVTVTDNAGGIPESILDKIFDPYFTTKGPDKGTGVGLFMSRTIVEKSMNGSLTARNVAGGAEFRIVL